MGYSEDASWICKAADKIYFFRPWIFVNSLFELDSNKNNLNATGMWDRKHMQNTKSLQFILHNFYINKKENAPNTTIIFF